MAKKPSDDVHNQGHPSEGSTDPDQPAYNPFLKFADVSKDGESFSITQGFTRRKPGRFGEQIIVEVVRKRDAKTFDFAIGVGSVNHRIMARRQGDEQRWHGELMLRTEQGQRSPFVAIMTDGDAPF
jgi:hypothetical protein